MIVVRASWYTRGEKSFARLIIDNQEIEIVGDIEAVDKIITLVESEAEKVIDQ